MGNTAKPTVLDHSLKLFIPTQCRCGKELPTDARKAVFEEAKQKMGSWFDGATLGVDRLLGLWSSESGDVAEEVVDVIHSYSDKDAFINNKEDFMAYAAELANLLTQDGVACELDGKLLIFPSTQNIKPHRCANGSASDQLPNPVDANELQKWKSLQAALLRLESVRDVRDLFCRKLHYDFVDDNDGQLPAHTWPESVTECLAPGSAPQIVAHKNGFKIIYIKLAKNSLRKSFERKIVQRIIKDDPSLRGLIVVSDMEAKQWELVNVKIDPKSEKKSSFLFRRMRIGPGQESRTAVERLAMVDTELFADDVTAAEIQDKQDEAFDVESVSKAFFNEISNWYFWALSQVEFPKDTLNDGDKEKHLATSLIRLLTRIIFCWFLKEKGLIPASLFDKKDLNAILNDLDDNSCTYHQGILQNLFFATLNQRMGKDSKGKPYRAFAKDVGFVEDKSTYDVDTVYRNKEHFKDPDKALSHFADVPFLNGGLFECLDRTDEGTGKKLYIDGFSRNKKKRARVPNELFFCGEQTVDLSGAYGDKKRKNAKVRGLLRILHAYNFTVEESTPIDEEIALDPELLGKVFENLLASYNEETKTTARKQTGSFYTPRPIVEYMVDESLKAHLCGALTKLGQNEDEAREQLNLLLGYTDKEPSFSEEKTNALLEAIHTCKILDPACGSGAFPIGMLQKLVHIVHKLDPGNTRWKQLQIDQASKIPDASARDVAIKAIKQDFEDNGDDYGRKLYLIESCLYGVDIQPIAIQISKLRFFISLICDQKMNRDKAKNHGVRALPNLETKFVAANTLVGLPEMDQMMLVAPRVNEIEDEIESLYHRHFSVQKRDQKLAIQKRLRDLRVELGQVLAESLGSSQKAEHLAEWDPFNLQNSADFFNPNWMFGKGLGEGFSIVLGNPPYVDSEAMTRIQPRKREAYAALFHCAKGNWDLFVLFIEKGLQLLDSEGSMSLIVPNKLLGAPYSEAARGLLQTTNIREMRDYSRVRVFKDADVYPIVFVAENKNPVNDVSMVVMGNETDAKAARSIAKDSFYADISWAKYFASEESTNLDDKLGKFDALGAHFPKTSGAATVAEAYEIREVVVERSEAGTSKAFRLINTGTIDPYACYWGVKKTRYLKGAFEEPVVRKSDLAGINTTRVQQAEAEKIVIGGMTKVLECYYDDGSCLAGKSTTIILGGSSLPLLYALAILNSKLISYWYQVRFKALILAGGYLRISQNEIRQVPLAIPTDDQLTAVVDLAVQALATRNSDPRADISDLVARIDKQIYGIYGLNEAEIEIIEGPVK